MRNAFDLHFRYAFIFLSPNSFSVSLFMLIFPRDFRVQRRSPEAVGSDHTAAQRLFWNWLEGRNLSPERYVEIWVCEQGITQELLLNWLGARVIPPQQILRGFLVFTSACPWFFFYFSFSQFLNHFPYLFSSRQKRKKHLAVLWLQIS